MIDCHMRMVLRGDLFIRRWDERNLMQVFMFSYAAKVYNITLCNTL